MSNVIYQDHFDIERHNSLKKTKYLKSSLTTSDVFQNVNKNVYYQMGCSENAEFATGLRAGKLTDYRQLLTNFLQQPHIKFLTALELSKTAPNESEVLCQIRHDVDADIVCCLPMAEIEAKLGIRSTYYILHTAPYYGSWQTSETEALFKRNECLAEHYLALQNLGHEVALHTDPLHIYQNYNADGLEALNKELNWLRSIGINISGCAPHNNPETYGASNSSIFKNFPVSELNPNHYQGVINNGKWAPLNQIDLQQLNLTYEADEVYKKNCVVDFISMTSENTWWRMHRQRDVYEEILSALRRDSNYDAINHLIKAHPEVYQDKSDFELDDQHLPIEVGNLSPKIVILSIHPEYYGWRANESSAPSAKNSLN